MLKIRQILNTFFINFKTHTEDLLRNMFKMQPRVSGAWYISSVGCTGNVPWPPLLTLPLPKESQFVDKLIKSH